MQIWPGGCQEELGYGYKENDRQRRQHTDGDKKELLYTECLESDELYYINRYLWVCVCLTCAGAAAGGGGGGGAGGGGGGGTGIA